MRKKQTGEMELIPCREEHCIFRQSLRAFAAREIIPFVDGWEDAGIIARRLGL